MWLHTYTDYVFLVCMTQENDTHLPIHRGVAQSCYTKLLEIKTALKENVIPQQIFTKQFLCKITPFSGESYFMTYFM